MVSLSLLRCAVLLLCVTLQPLVQAAGRSGGRRFHHPHSFSGVRARQAHKTIAPRQDAPPVYDRNGTAIPPYETVYWFDQLIDHSDPSRGTFKQRYWHTWEYYVPGGPIFLMNPGELGADNFISHLTTTRITGSMANATNGATIVLEHRFFGLSLPFQQPTVEQLSVHTIDQAMDDMVYFAQNVVLPMPGGASASIRPDQTPWILVGGSYGGALASWTIQQRPGVFWAAYSSSGVVQPIADFWQYFEPIRSHMPQNCSADVSRVIEHVDSIVSTRDPFQVQELKEFFSLGDVATTADFLLFMHAPLLEWQSLDPETSSDSNFYTFCDRLEVNANGDSAPAEGFGLDHALQAWSDYYASAQLVSEYSASPVVDTQAAPGPGDYDADAWDWMVCNELGWILRGPPPGYTPLSSRNYRLEDKDLSCREQFPDAFPELSIISARVSDMSAQYSISRPNAADQFPNRIITVNGRRDPWLYATLSSPDLPTGNFNFNSPGTRPDNLNLNGTNPIFLTDGFHCSDLAMRSEASVPDIANVQQQAIQIMQRWVGEFQSSLVDAASRAPGSGTRTARITTTVTWSPGASSSATRPPSAASRRSSTGLVGIPILVSLLWSLL